MTPNEIIDAFGDATERLRVFRSRHQRGDRSGLDAIVEAQIRLEQAAHMLRDFQKCEYASVRRA